MFFCMSIDPEEFLNILLKHVCSPEPYLKIR